MSVSKIKLPMMQSVVFSHEFNFKTSYFHNRLVEYQGVGYVGALYIDTNCNKFFNLYAVYDGYPSGISLELSRPFPFTHSTFQILDSNIPSLLSREIRELEKKILALKVFI